MGRSSLVRGPIDEDAELRSVLSISDRTGAVVTFRGVIRGISPNGRVEKLYYDFYPEMAERSLEEIRTKAMEKFGLIDATILHRVGEVPVGEIALLVIAASEHREAAFEAARWMVDEVKRVAAIWKKEIFSSGGARWVEGEVRNSDPSSETANSSNHRGVGGGGGGS